MCKCLSIFVFSIIQSSSTLGYHVPKGRRHKELGLESGEGKSLTRLIDFKADVLKTCTVKILMSSFFGGMRRSSKFNYELSVTFSSYEVFCSRYLGYKEAGEVSLLWALQTCLRYVWCYLLWQAHKKQRVSKNLKAECCSIELTDTWLWSKILHSALGLLQQST